MTDLGSSNMEKSRRQSSAGRVGANEETVEDAICWHRNKATDPGLKVTRVTGHVVWCQQKRCLRLMMDCANIPIGNPLSL